MSPPLSVIELRQYALHPGRRDELIALFEREGEPVIAWLTRFDDEAAQRRHAALSVASGGLVRPEWRALLSGEPVHLRLASTARSALRRHQPQ
jgi:hypothetical protein